MTLTQWLMVTWVGSLFAATLLLLITAVVLRRIMQPANRNQALAIDQRRRGELAELRRCSERPLLHPVARLPLPVRAVERKMNEAIAVL